MIRCRILSALLCLLLSPITLAAEVIHDFASEIRIDASGGMRVHESIEVKAEGKQIRHGIYRDFPTDYRDRLGNHYRVGFEILAVKRDGHPEPYHTERRRNGVRIYLGDANTMVSKGVHRYEIRYATNRQLGFFDDHDELYWNVTGNGWRFPIRHASAQLRLPGHLSTSMLTLEAYTGPQGARGRAYRAWTDTEGSAHFETNTTLNAGEGLTIVVGWPKGVVHAPTRGEQLHWFLADNRSAVTGVIGLGLLLAYYLVAWWRVGRDPEAGVIIPRYTPPDGLSPAAMRFIRHMGYDNKAFTAAVIDLAVKGVLRIEEHDKSYTLTRTAERPATSPGEERLATELFRTGSQLIIEQTNHHALQRAREAHKKLLKREYEKRYFMVNGRYLVPGVLASLLTLFVMVMQTGTGEHRFIAGFLTLWLSGWSAAVLFLLHSTWQGWRALISGGGTTITALRTTLISAVFIGFELFAMAGLITEAGITLPLILVLAVAINVLFYQLLKAPTRLGRQLLDRIDGFRLYLSVAEGEELALKHPPEKTPALFERYLPYALALDVEQAWAERFADVLGQVQADGRSSTAYQPAWYRGSGWQRGGLPALAGTLGGAMTGAIAAASTTPGSSSGGGGGGFSGGGGGGGGGGGW